MKVRTAILCALLGALLGGAGCYQFFRTSVSVEEFRKASQAHRAAMLQVDRLTAQRDAAVTRATLAGRAVDSLRHLRAITRLAVLQNPDSTGAAMGIEATAPDSGTRCIPLTVYASLLAARAELIFADSQARWQESSTSACLEALSYSDSAAGVAIEDATNLHRAGQGLAGEVGHLRRTRWLWAAGGAAAAFLAVFGAGAL